MPDYGVVCSASGPPQDPVELGSSLAALLTTLKEFRPLGQFENDGTGYQATLSVTAPSATEAEGIAQRAVTMAAASTRLPTWSISVVESFELPPEN